MGRSWITGSDFPTFILFLMIVWAVIITLLRWIDINKIIKIRREKMDDYTMQQYYRGLISPEMRAYIEEEMRSEAEYDAAERAYYSRTSPFEYSPSPPTDEEIALYNDEQYKKKLNLARDEKGRLKKGATIARKRICDEEDLWSLYSGGYTVKKIIELRGCSKSTVYNVIKKYKEKGADIKKQKFPVPNFTTQ